MKPIFAISASFIALSTSPMLAFSSSPTPGPTSEPPAVDRPDNDHEWKPAPTQRKPVTCDVGWYLVPATFWHLEKCVRVEGITEQNGGGKWK